MVTVASDALSAEIEIPSSFNPVGSGARALGMGGAFIAVADDATAASWNPGGLTQLKKPECSVVFSGLHRKEDISFGTNPEGDGMQSVSEEDLNYLSVTYPFEAWGRNMVVSLAYQHLYDFYREWEFTLNETVDDLSVSRRWEYDHAGRLSAIGLSYAVRVVPKLSLGFTLNFWDNDITQNEWKQKYHMNGIESSDDISFDRKLLARYRTYRFDGFNMNFGLLWRINYNLTFGAVLKTPFTADISRKEEQYWKVIESDSDIYTGSNIASKADKLDMPMSYGIGVHYNFSDALSVSADLYRTEWSDYIYKTEDGPDYSPITGRPISETSIDDTCQVRLGGEYRFMNKEKEYVVPIRFGVFYDPVPADGSPDDVYGISIGLGFTKNNFFSLDLSYQYRFGNNVGEIYLKHFDFSQDLDEHTVYASLIIYKW
ncbi:hypothetical protein DENIS_0586 [Desulfonema ishimotonii]|uniref:Aromatic hydrocarbon degradation protein n=1 Tax=Desulfonema ishimotonii TaxID=45657 RepID=A0A401FRQ1_9BACT|nr:hypothetical protein DENIS_0586 [Desulfonema ishimotonii]